MLELRLGEYTAEALRARSKQRFTKDIFTRKHLARQGCNQKLDTTTKHTKSTKQENIL